MRLANLEHAFNNNIATGQSRSIEACFLVIYERLEDARILVGQDENQHGQVVRGVIWLATRMIDGLSGMCGVGGGN